MDQKGSLLEHSTRARRPRGSRQMSAFSCRAKGSPPTGPDEDLPLFRGDRFDGGRSLLHLSNAFDIEFVGSVESVDAVLLLKNVS